MNKPFQIPFEIVVKTKHQDSVVIKTRPFWKGKPFPTLYWLTDTFLIKRIFEIESQGGVAKVSAWLKENPMYMGIYHQNHRNYQLIRQKEFTDQDIAELQKENRLVSFNSLGISGIRDFNQVKCLHTHYAHYLAQDNIIGEYLVKNFQLPSKDEFMFENSSISH